MVTAELAVALPTLAVLVVLALSAIAVVYAQLRCVDAAAVAARMAARGEAARLVQAQAQAAAPRGAVVRLDVASGTVTADVSALLRFPGIGRLLPGFGVHARVVMANEAPDPVTP